MTGLAWSRCCALIAAIAVTGAACGTTVPEGASDLPIGDPTPTPATAFPPEEEPTSPPSPPSETAQPTNTTEPTPSETSSAQPTPTAPQPVPTVDPELLNVEVPEQVSVTLTPLLEIVEPIALVARAGSPNLFLATRPGSVLELAIDGNEATVIREVLDLGSEVSNGNEQGLLGLTFSPDGSEIYVNFTDADGTTNVVGWAMDGDDVDQSSRRLILQVRQPAPNHNGGDVKFGPDGYLYIGLGDGGGGGDEFGHGQNTETLLATILRIVPALEGEAPYLVPADNPFIDGGGLREIFIWGARNPWRFSFDRLTGDLWIGDVGQRTIEEIDVLYSVDGGGRGANLGWPDVEGSAPFNAAGPPAENYVGPIYDYTHDPGCSVTGGYVYRGNRIPELYGQYVFADLCRSDVRGIASSREQGFLGHYELGVRPPGGQAVSFGEDLDGELYLLSFNNTVYRLDPA